MIPYWVVFGIPAIAALFEREKLHGLREKDYAIISMHCFIAVIVGLRFEVGGDWLNYINYFTKAGIIDLNRVIYSSDPGFIFTNWIVARFGEKVWIVNLICAAIFSFGLYKFSISQPRPWLASAVAVPYLVIVVGMGYTRQAVAIGLAMWGLVELGQAKSRVKFVVLVVLAATFHKTAILLIPIAALSIRHGRLWSIFWVGAAAIIGYYALLSGSVDSLVKNYIEAGYQSGGAAIRIGMSAVPALFFLIHIRKFQISSDEKTLWMIISFISIMFIFLLVASPSSTAVDRIGLYVIPLQLFVFSHIPGILSVNISTQSLVSAMILIYSFIIQIAWLNYSTYSAYWVPYKFYPF